MSTGGPSSPACSVSRTWGEVRVNRDYLMAELLQARRNPFALRRRLDQYSHLRPLAYRGAPARRGRAAAGMHASGARDNAVGSPYLADREADHADRDRRPAQVEVAVAVALVATEHQRVAGRELPALARCDQLDASALAGQVLAGAGRVRDAAKLATGHELHARDLE